MKLVPYIYYNNTQEAIDFYQSLGIELKQVIYAKKEFFAYLPWIRPYSMEDQQFVMHAELELLGQKIFCSDSWDQDRDVDNYHSRIAIEFSFKNPDHLAKVEEFFERAKQSPCVIQMPLEALQPSLFYGQMIDPFGLTWVFIGRDLDELDSFYSSGHRQA